MVGGVCGVLSRSPPECSEHLETTLSLLCVGFPRLLPLSPVFLSFLVFCVIFFCDFFFPTNRSPARLCSFSL